MGLQTQAQARIKSAQYNHQAYETRRKILRLLMKQVGFRFLAKLGDVQGLANVPATGPVIFMINHIALIDPIVVLHLVPRNIVPLAKIEVYDYPVIGIFPKIWGVIPVRREEIDRRAVQQVLEVLDANESVLVAPEGTRSPALQEAKVGVAYLASRSGAPVVPVAIDGTPGFPAMKWQDRWRGPAIDVHFGRPFVYKPEFNHAGKEHLRKMADEAMYILASLLPPARRGIYHNLSNATQDTILWE